MPDTEKRVVTTMPLEIDHVTRPAGTELHLSEADADALVESGRARHVDEEGKVQGEEERRPDDARPGEQVAPVQADTPAPAAASESPAEEH